MEYKLKYNAVYRDKDWVTLSKRFSAPNNAASAKKARRIVSALDRQAQKKSDGLERRELVSVRRITHRAVSEKTARVSFS